MAIHNEFLNIHLYIHICHCQVCSCCFYCLEGCICILRTKNKKDCLPKFASDLQPFLVIVWLYIITRFTRLIHTWNGICNQKYHFWPKNDGEKWSRKIYFEIPPCGKIVIFITEFVILGTFMKQKIVVSCMEEFQKKISQTTFHHHF